MKHKLITSVLLTLFPLIWITSCSMVDNQAFASKQLTTGFITNKKINEASGIAVSAINKNIIWVNNDSGNKAAIYAINEQGEHLATVNISGVKNNDWEDLATFNYQNENYIVIANTGDNKAKRKHYQLLVIKEPTLRINNHVPEIITIQPEWTIRFQYEDKSRDCESLAVDTVNNQILLLSKREFPPQLFTLPLKVDETQQILTAQKLGPITPFPAPLKERFGILDIMNYSNMPTAMDISADNTMATILTYSGAYLYFKEESASWLETFAKKPKLIDFPLLEQGEAIGFDPSGKNIYITSEKIPAPILKIAINQYKSN